MTPSLYTNDLFVLIHGLSSSRNEWFNEHKKLTDYFISNSIPFVALDLYGHGSFSAVEQEFNTEYIDDDLWPIFIDKSVSKFVNTISTEDHKRSLKSIHIISYSVGSVVAIEIAKKLNKCKSLSLAVPNPDYEVNDDYSLCNSIKNVKNIKASVFSGTVDEEVTYEDIKTFVKENNYINHYSYDAGHLLPHKWIDDLLSNYE